MSLRRSLELAYHRTHESIFLIGFAVAVLVTVGSVATAFVAASVTPLLAPVVELLGVAVTSLLVGPLLVAIYVPVLRGTETTRETVVCGLDAVRTHYLDVFRAIGGAIAVVAAAGVFGMVVLYLGKTAHSLFVHLTGEPRFILPLGLFNPLVNAFGVSVLLATILTQFSDVATVRRADRPWLAWRDSLRFVQHNPLTVVGYVVIVAVAFAIPLAVVESAGPQPIDGVLWTTRQGTAYVLVTALVLLFQTVSITVLAGLRVTLYANWDDGRVRSDVERTLPWRRIAVMAIVLLAGVAGATYVRTVDVSVESNEFEPLTDDPSSALEVAASNTAQANHRMVAVLHNETGNESDTRLLYRAGYDYDDRQQYYFIHTSNESYFGGYFSEATLATRSSDDRSRPSRLLGPLTRREGNWSVIVGNGYGVVRETQSPDLDLAPSNWSVADSTDSTITYRIDNPDRFPVRSDLYRTHNREELDDESYAEAVVDRERGVVREVRLHLRLRDSRLSYTQVMRYEDIGTVDVERPEEFGDRRLLGWVFDALYY